MPTRRRFAFFATRWFSVAIAVLCFLAVGCERPLVEAVAFQPGSQPTGRSTPRGAVPENPFPRRLLAPPLSGGVDWINTAGPLSLQDLRGKFVLLDFWTYCCINCMHVLPELKQLEQKFPNELVVIGVHTAKFDTEKDSDNIAEAVLRYNIEHPVINDAEHVVWSRFGISSWPTIVLIDPEGYAVFARPGEFKAESIEPLLRDGIAYYRARGSLDETPLRFDLEAYSAAKTPLSFPGKVLADEASNRLFVADSNHNRIVIAQLDGQLIDVIGSGASGRTDGSFDEASFNQPQGMALRGDTLYVADTSNHLIRKIDLAARTVERIAGTGEQTRFPWPGIEVDGSGAVTRRRAAGRLVGRPLATPLGSPWDLYIQDDALYIAMAGPHQIWKMPLDESEIGPYAGNGREDIVDGPLLPRTPYDAGYASFAQPSGLTSDGTWLYVADSEGSSIRAVPFQAHLPSRTIVGSAHLANGRLFAFGDLDGQGDRVRLQHALGVVWYRDRIYLTDTYNNKIKVLDVNARTCQTIAGSGKPGRSDDPPLFDEPAGITAAAGKLYVADTNNHAIRVVDLDNGNRVSTLAIRGLDPPADDASQTPEPAVRNGQETPVRAVTLGVGGESVPVTFSVTLPEGFRLNELAPMAYRVEVVDAGTALTEVPASTTTRVDPPALELQVPLPVASSAGRAVVRISLNVYYCRDGAEGICKVGTLAWRMPIVYAADASAPSRPMRLQAQIE